MGIPHCEDVGTPKAEGGPSCRACSGAHRRHTYATGCERAPGHKKPPKRQTTMPPRYPAYKGGRRSFIVPTSTPGPNFKPCTKLRGHTNAAISEAKAAMLALADHPTPYPGAAQPPSHTMGNKDGESAADQAVPRRDPNGKAQPAAPPSLSPRVPVNSAGPATRPANNTAPEQANTRLQPNTGSTLCTTALAMAMKESLATSAAGPRDLDPDLQRLTSLDKVPPPVAQPFAIGFPDDLATKEPGLHAVLNELGAELVECGATSAARNQPWQQNQCLYLSLAAALAGAPEELHDLAHELRITIEAAVRAARLNWAARDLLGEEIGAFADFLIWGLQATPRLKGRAVAVYDARTGTCEIFRNTARQDLNAAAIALWFSGAHYRWVRWRDPAPTLPQLLNSHAAGHPGRPRVPTLTIEAVE